MAYVAPSTVTTLQTYTSAAHNIIVNDIIDLDARANTIGLKWISTTSFSAASSVTVNNCFSSTYQSYRVLVQCSSPGTNVLLYANLMNGASRVTSGYNAARRSYDILASTASFTTGATSSSDMLIGAAKASTIVTFDITDPANAAVTSYHGTSFGEQYGAYIYGHIFAGQQGDSTSYSGLYLYPSTSTISGNIRIYGYV